ncbi:MAG: aldehyde dehydrogenase EutE [Myxococcales bacterium]|nr:aldehyde dehydrogenase EutE [Myxococcales bacterium]
MKVDERTIATIVERVVTRLQGESAPTRAAIGAPTVIAAPRMAQEGVFDDIDGAATAARAAFEEFEGQPLELRRKVIEAIRQTCREHLNDLARMAVEETGLGRYEDKLIKNNAVIELTPGTEILRPISYTGDNGLVLIERAPYGVIGSITPSTNPSETIICNAIGMVAGGNAVVFNPHPGAKNLSVFLIRLLNRAIVAAGGPKNLLTTVGAPTIESAQAMMKHPKVRLLVVTGGGAVVKAAMGSGKRAIAAGPGNPPVVVDETAPLDRAARDIISGASLDNNIVCIVEKEIIAVAEIADKLKAELRRGPALELNARQTQQLEKVLITPDNHVNRDFIGKNANRILAEIGVRAADDLRIIFCEVDEHHPFVQHEMLMPVIGLVRAKNADEAIAMAKRVEHGFGHTAVMHSLHIGRLSAMARTINTSIFVKNAPSYAGLSIGGEGYTSFTIASPTGEGLTTAVSFTRERRCTLKDHFRIV